MLTTARPLDPASIDARRFWLNVRTAGPDDCWEWNGSRFRDGYGQAHHNGSSHPAHRLAWALGNSACLLPGLLVRHDCDNPPCCNPAHLRPGTAADNAADAKQRGRTVKGRRRMMPSGPDAHAWSERCRRGHDPALRYLTKSGKRRCRECDRLCRRSSC